jgi:AcrR family transcriptional regulator
MTKTPALSKKARTRGPDYEPPAPRSRAARTGPGRPSKYDEAVALATACALARKGYTNVEIAEEMGIHISTLYRYFADTPEFRDAVKNAKDVIDDRVQASLLQRATGYRQRVEKVFANGVRMQVIEEVQPDTTAQIFWLKNRRRSEFRDTREIDLVVPDNGPAPEETDTRQLALAAIALLSDAEGEALDAGPVLDMEPNSTFDEEIEDAETDDRPRDQSARSQSADADFDLD